MTLGSLRSTLSGYFFNPVTPYPAAVFRILFGMCVCATLMLLHGDWSNWFGVPGWISMGTIDQAETGFRLNLFALAPYSEVWIDSLYWVFLCAALTLTVGLGTRLSSIVVFLGLNSMNQRMPLIFHGGDTFLRSASFFLMFASCGSVLSVDRSMRLRRNPAGSSDVAPITPWPLRLIQCQLAILYLASFWWKTKGGTWWDGTALFYVVHLGELRRFAIPHMFYHAWLLRVGGWCAMAFELLFPLLVWFRRFRIPVLAAGVLFHLSLEYALNIPMFQWDVLSAYVLFL